MGSEISEGMAENCSEWLWKSHGNPEWMVRAKILSLRAPFSEGWARETESRQLNGASVSSTKGIRVEFGERTEK